MEGFVKDALLNQQDLSGLRVGEANIVVVGCGGAGNNMVSWLHKKGLEGAKIYDVNTDLQHLQISQADGKILIGKELTRGL